MAEECPHIRCYRIKVETPFAIMQSIETTWIGLKKEDFIDRVKSDWGEFAKRHNIQVKTDIEEIPCSEIHKVRRFFKKK